MVLHSLFKMTLNISLNASIYATRLVQYKKLPCIYRRIHETPDVKIRVHLPHTSCISYGKVSTSDKKTEVTGNMPKNEKGSVLGSVRTEQ